MPTCDLFCSCHRYDVRSGLFSILEQEQEQEQEEVLIGCCIQMVVNGHRPSVPESCPSAYAELMKDCWHNGANGL